MRFSIFPLIAIVTASFVSATAAGQFKLGVTNDASRCFLECHHQVVNFFNLPGQPSNDPVAYGPNCRLGEWNRMITQCLVLGCQSPPDLAYAMEYATSICGRAGVKVKLELPEEYLDTVDGAYFRSDLYLRSNDAPRQGFSTGALGTAVAIGIAGAALI